jgi:hypothetical protein
MNPWIWILIILGILLLIGIPIVLYFTLFRKNLNKKSPLTPLTPSKPPSPLVPLVPPKPPSHNQPLKHPLKFAIRPVADQSLRITTYNPQTSPGVYTPWLVLAKDSTQKCSWFSWENRNYDTPLEKIESPLIFDGNLPQFPNYLPYMEPVQLTQYLTGLSLTQTSGANTPYSFKYNPSDKTWCVLNSPIRSCLYYDETIGDNLLLQPFDSKHIKGFQWINDPEGIKPPSCVA